MDNQFFLLCCIDSAGEHFLRVSDNREESFRIYDSLVEEFGVVSPDTTVGGTLVLLQVPYDLLIFSKEDFLKRYPGEISDHPVFAGYMPIVFAINEAPDGGIVPADSIVFVPTAGVQMNSFYLDKRFFEANLKK